MLDFNPREGDVIDIHRIANTRHGDQPYTYAGAGPTGSGREYTVVFDSLSNMTVLNLYSNADTLADATIHIVGDFTVDAGYDPSTWVMNFGI